MYARPPRPKAGDVPTRTFSKTGVEITALGQGGAKLAYLRSKESACEHVRYACGLGINYFDCARTYWDGHSEEVYGEVLPEFRKSVFLTTKSHQRTRKGAERELRESLRALKTDYVDLWQMHSIQSSEDIEQIFAPGGALEAFAAARQEGHCRFIGFSAHYDPRIALEMLDRCADVVDTILMPLHAADPHYLSFEKNVLPAAVEAGVAIQAMKLFGSAGLLRDLHVAECVHYSLSLPVHAAVVGCSSFGHWDDDIRAVRNFKKLNTTQLAAIRDRVGGPERRHFNGARLEYWKRGDG
jgi:aryl-alcohol dehydrogenase-like predicted oxidoreductase